MDDWTNHQNHFALSHECHLCVEAKYGLDVAKAMQRFWNRQGEVKTVVLLRESYERAKTEWESANPEEVSYERYWYGYMSALRDLLAKLPKGEGELEPIHYDDDGGA